MLEANVLLMGEASATRLPLRSIRMAAAVGFAAAGLWVSLTGSLRIRPDRS